MMLARTIPLAAALLVAAPAAAQSVFTDWAVACDNGARCEAASLLPEPRLPGDGAVLMLRLEPGAAGAASVLVQDTGAGQSSVVVAVDGRRVASGGAISDEGTRFTGAQATAIVRAIASGRALTVARPGGAAQRVSLAGSTAMLRFVDAAQGRAGTVAAWVAKGRKPARAVPGPRPLPRIAARRVRGAETPLSRGESARLRKQAGCEEDYLPETLRQGSTYPLDQGRELLVVPCGAGAYNAWSVLYVRAGKAIQPAQLDARSRGPGDQEQSLVNVGVANGIVTAYSKGRGLGDCGVAQGFAWDGSRFRLVEQRELRECRGNPNWLTTFRAVPVFR